MSTAEKIFVKAQALPEDAQTALLHIVELLRKEMPATSHVQPKAGSAKGLITLADDFDEPVEDFKPYME